MTVLGDGLETSASALPIDVEPRPQRQPAIAMAAWLVPAQGVQTLLTMVVGIVAARSLGPAGLGQLSFVLATLALLSPLVISHRQVMVRDLVNEPDQRSAILGAGLALGLMSAGVATLAGSGFAVLSGQNATTTAAMVVALAGLFGIAIAGSETSLQAAHHPRHVAFVRIAPAMGGTLLRLSALAGGLGVIGFVAAGAVQAVVSAALCLVVVRRSTGDRPGWPVDRKRLYQMFRQSWPFAISALSIAVYMSMDQVMLGLMSTENETGVYAAAARLSESTMLLPMVLLTSVTPTLVASFGADSGLYRAQTQRFVNVLTAMGVLIAIVGSAISVPAIRVLYGPGFGGTAAILVILLIANMFSFQGIASSVWIVNEGLQRSYMTRTIIGALLNVGLNLVLIPHHGGVGAGLASVVAYGYAALIGTAVDRRSRPLALILVRAMRPRSLIRSVVHEIPDLVRRRPIGAVSDESQGGPS